MVLKKRHIIIIALAAAAIGVSLVLVPGQKEMALMQFKNNRFADAYRLYQAQLAEGDLSWDTTNNLADIYLGEGKINDAIKTIETYVSIHPRQMQARKRLGLLYQFAKRENDYIRNLEEMSKLAPDVETLDKLSQVYSYFGEYDKQANVLQNLIKLEGNKDASLDIQLGDVLAQHEPYDKLRKNLALQLASGKISTKVVFEAFLNIRNGDPNKAAGILEILVAAHPDDLVNLERLAYYYLQAKRLNDCIHVWKTIAKLKPSVRAYESLSWLYNVTQQYGKQVAVLKRLIAFEHGKDPSHYIDLAYADSSLHAYADAVTTLRTLHTNFPKEFKFDEAFLLVSSLLDDKKPDEALREAASWVDKYRKTDEGAKLIGLLHFKADTDTARALLKHFADKQINGNGPLLEQYVLLESEDHEEEVYTRLKSLEAKDELPSQVSRYLLFMAEENGDHALASGIVSCMNLAALPEDELLSLVELAQGKNDSELLATIKSAFPPAEYTKSRPILLAILAVAMHDADAPEQLKKLDALNLSSSDDLHVARVCVYVKNYDCTNHFLVRIQKNEGLSDAEFAAIASLYFHMDEQDTGYIFITGVLKTHPGPAVEAVAAQYDAARGDSVKVMAWLKANPDAKKETLAALYYAAANYHRLLTAVLIAEIFHQRYDIPLSRTVLADAYVKTGQFEEAADLLRHVRPLSETDEDSYVNALSGLSADPKYREELGQYIAQQIATDIPEKRKLGLTYVAINAHAITYAMPYIHTLAEQKGAQWAWIYVGELAKEGRYAEARPFWVKLAQEADTSAKDKLGIGYTLMSHGFKADAETIFFTSARAAPADSDAVRLLMFVWGPRPDAKQLAWIENRFAQAKGKDREDWAKLIASITDDDAVITFVHRQPDSLDDKTLASRYFNALASRGELAAQTDAVIAAAKATHQIERLRQFATAAQGNSLSTEARRAWETILALHPGDPDALRQAGSIALGEGDTKDAARYLNAYLQGGSWQHMSPKDTYHVFFAYAEFLRGQHHVNQAKPYYRYAIDLIDNGKLKDSGAQTVKGLSQIHLDDVAGGLNTFESAVAADPGNANLRADWIAALIDLKRYDEAKELLAIPPDETFSQPVATITLPPGMIVSYGVHNGGHELLLTMAQPVKGAVMKSPPWKSATWISYISQGYDSLLIVPKAGYLVTIDAQGKTIAAVPDTASPSFKGGNQVMLRFAILETSIDLDTGHLYDALKRVMRMKRDYDKSSGFLSFAASVESAAGDWPQAEELAAAAQAMAPEDKGLARYNRYLQHAHAPNVMLDDSFTSYQGGTESITTLSGDGAAKDHMQVSGIVQNMQLTIQDGRRPDGSVGRFAGNKQRAEMYLQYYAGDGRVFKFSLFGNDKSVGIGAYDRFLNPLGETLVGAEWHKPYWDILEAVWDDANRDRLSVTETLKPTPKITVTATPAVNRYNSEGKDGLATSVSGTLSASYLLDDEPPALSLVYSLDAEYVQQSKRGFDNSGAYTRLFPLTDRAVHTLTLNSSYNFNDDVSSLLSAGYSYDQFGGTGSAALSASLNWAMTETIDMQFRAAYGFAGANVGSASTTFGGFVRWRF